MDQIGRRAVVIGAGIGGLAASAALAPFFEQVLVLERSELPDAAVPRSGVPQGQQPHVLLGGGQRALEQLAPGLTLDLCAAGARRYRVGLETRYERPGFDPFPQRDLGWDGYALSRPALELALRRRVHVANVACEANCRVERVLLSDSGQRVAGVEVSAGGRTRSVSSELVVDASGSGAPTLQALVASGAPAPEETRIEVDIAYASAVFAAPHERREWQMLLTLPDAPRESRAALIIAQENGREIGLVAGRHGDHPPADWAGFFEYARGLRTPTFHASLSRVERLGGVSRFGFRASVWRHFERAPRLPVGLLPLGDAVCRFNPIYGQGMSAAAQQACLLRAALTEAGGLEPLALASRTFLAGLGPLLEAPWALAASPDLVYSYTRGERPPFFAESQRESAALLRLASMDAEVHRLMLQVQHLLRPMSALRAPDLRERVRELLASQGGSA